MKLLFSEFQLKHLRLPNRVVMAPVGTNLASAEGFVTDALIEYYRCRAQGGTGLIIVEAAAVEPRGITLPRELNIHDDKSLAGLQRLASTIKKEGALAALQIQHSGRQTNSEIIGTTPIAPSSLPCPRSKETSKEMTVEDIEKVIECFASAALKVKQAGFDAVEIHGASGYLLSQFLSPHTNKRKDHFGGNLAGRARFPLEIVKRVIQTVGPDFVVGYRLAAEEFLDDGLHLEESLQFVKMLEKKGIDFMHATAGIIYETGEWIASPIYVAPGALVYIADAIKKITRVPVIAVGRINTPQQAEEILQAGKADLIAMGRALVGDPFFVKKAKEGRENDIRHCIACNYCASRVVAEQTKIACTVNPEAGREKEFDIVKTQTPKKVVILGGGVGGLEAARVLKLRGHDVKLYEAKDHLGGTLFLASKGPHKEELLCVIDYYKTQVEKLNIPIFLNRFMSEDDVLAEKPQAVVIATGSKPKLPEIKGLKTSGALQINDVYDRDGNVGPNTVVIGGGSSGGEVAAYLAAKGKDVTILEMRKHILIDLETLNRKALIEELKNGGVRWKTLVKVLQVGQDFVRFMDAEENDQKIATDTIVIATGALPNNELETVLKTKVPEIYNIGDSFRPRRATEAIFEGALIGRQI